MRLMSENSGVKTPVGHSGLEEWEGGIFDGGSCDVGDVGGEADVRAVQGDV